MRHNIYLPDELSKAVQQAGIPMSAVCQRALEEEVRKVQATKEAGSDLEEVAARLRETRADEQRGAYTDGVEAGTTWAKEHATFSELRGIVKLRASQNWTRQTIDEQDHSLAWFLGRIWGDDPGGTNLRYLLERGDPFIEGVLDGAAEVYRQVTPLL